MSEFINDFQSAVSASILEFNNKMLGLAPLNYRRQMRFLDIGAGVSSVSAELADNYGVESYAVDICYASLQSLLDRNQEQINYAFLNGRDGMSLASGMFEIARRKFVADQQQNPSRYVAADARALPFDDKSFDLVQSCMLIDIEYSLDTDFATQSVSEAVRVLKRGGKLVIGPGFLGSGMRWQAHQNVYNALDIMKSKKDRLARLNVDGTQVLHFQKG